MPQIEYVADLRIPYAPFSKRQREYMQKSFKSKFNVLEGAVRSGKTIIHCFLFHLYLEWTKDKIHLASGSTLANAKLNIGECNGFGLEHLFKGRCRWTKFKENDALEVTCLDGSVKYVIFAGGGKADSYKKILGNSYGGWIATEINEHYDGDNPKESFIKVAFDRQIASVNPRIFWDLNPSHPRHKIYTEYIDKYLEGYEGGYNYCLMTIKDNLSISSQRYKEIVSQYNKKSLWFKRNIEGQRIMSSGLVFEYLKENEHKYKIAPSDVEHYSQGQFMTNENVKIKMSDIAKVNVGLDFGGNRSNHSIVFALILNNYKGVVFWRSDVLIAKGMNVTTLVKEVFKRIVDVRREFPNKPMTMRCDSAEQTIINEIYTYGKVNAIPCIIQNAVKSPILDRIRGLDSMLGMSVVWWVDKQADTSFEAEASCVWRNEDGRVIDERLDDGTTDIDTCDATEYSFEEFINNIIKMQNYLNRGGIRA